MESLPKMAMPAGHPPVKTTTLVDGPVDVVVAGQNYGRGFGRVSKIIYREG